MNEKVLCVDDDPNVLAGFHRRLRRQFQIVTAPTAEQALNELKTRGPFAVIVSDMRMPGMDGVQFLARAKAIAPDSVRIMLTGLSDQATAVEAVNEGSIFRFLTKPCNSEVLAQAISAGVEQYRLVTAEKELLGKTLRGSIRLLIDLLSLVNPVAFGRASRVQRLVRQLASALRVERSWEFDIAAMLSQIGCVTLPPEVMDKLRHGEQLTVDEKRMVSAHPAVGRDLVARIPRLERVADIIGLQERCYDGSDGAAGAPKGSDIPLAARVLKVALDYDALRSTGLSGVAAVVELYGRSGHYDPDVLAAMRGIAQAEESAEIRDVYAEELTDGMILAEDVLSTTGVLVVSRGQEVSPYLRQRLRNYAVHASVREPIRVFVRTA